MDSEDAPPPYSAVDPLLNEASNTNADSNGLNLRGGEVQPQDVISRDDSASSIRDSTSVSSVLPANFSSAVAYFAERPPAVVDDGRGILDHHLTIYPRSRSKDFPRRPRCWSSRTEDITQQDWDMFLRYLFPPHLGLASASGHLPRQLAAEIQRDRKDRPQETDEQRKLRIDAVIAEWNQYFFEPRGARVMFVYVTNLGNAPLSPLCPRCYPAATKASRETQPSPTEAGDSRGSPQSDLPPAFGEHHGAPPFGPGQYAHHNMGHRLPFFSPFGMPPVPPVPPAPHRVSTPSAPPAPPAPPGVPGVPSPPMPRHLPVNSQQGWWPLPNPPWGWHNKLYGPQGDTGFKGGPLSWVTQFASHAQKYGERVSEQAQQYGDLFRVQAEDYGRHIEEQAMARGRWIEELAKARGRKVEDLGDALTGFVRRPSEQWRRPDELQQPAPVDTGAMPTPPVQHTRRTSVSSASSDDSLSSIDSISTTSDLDSSDLATIRAQLQSLDNHHDRDLYDAAVSLRRQLDTLQQSRRQARIPGNCHWHPSRRNHPHQGCGRGGRGRWDPPHQQRHNIVEKRAMKEEMKATKRAFRDIYRRARDEQREKRKARRNRRRQAQKLQKKQQKNQSAQEPSLERRMEDLELGVRGDGQPVGQSASRQRSPSASSAASEVSIASTPSVVSSEGGCENGATKEELAKEGQQAAEKQRKDDGHDAASSAGS